MEVEAKKTARKIYNDAYSLPPKEFEDQHPLNNGSNYKNSVEIDLALDLVNRFSEYDDLILDAGCGTGRISIPCARTGAKVIGIDISINEIKLAHSIAIRENCDFVLADIEYLPFKDLLFRFVFFFGTLEYIDKPEKVLKETYRVTKEGGRLLLEVRNRNGQKFRHLAMGVPKFFERLRKTAKTPSIAKYYYDRCYNYSVPEINEKLICSRYRIESYSGHFFILPSDLNLFEEMLGKGVGANSRSLKKISLILNRVISTSVFGSIVSGTIRIIAKKY